MAKKEVSNRDLIDYTDELYVLGRVPIDDKTEQPLIKIESRCKEYYEICRRYDLTPSVEGLAMVMGTSREELLNWAVGKYQWTKGDIAQYLHKEIARLNEILVKANQHGLIRDIPTIFWSKNNFGYQNEDQKKTMEIQITMPTKEQLIEQSKNLEIIQKS